MRVDFAKSLMDTLLEASSDLAFDHQVQCVHLGRGAGFHAAIFVDPSGDFFQPSSDRVEAADQCPAADDGGKAVTYSRVCFFWHGCSPVTWYALVGMDSNSFGALNVCDSFSDWWCCLHS